MNKIRKILSVIPILSCICVLSLTTHAAENQNKNYLSDLRAYAGVESKENIIKDFKPDKLEYSIVVPNEKVSVGAKMSENVQIVRLLHIIHVICLDIVGLTM